MAPLRPLLALTVGVLAFHAWLLAPAHPEMKASDASPQPFLVRATLVQPALAAPRVVAQAGASRPTDQVLPAAPAAPSTTKAPPAMSSAVVGAAHAVPIAAIAPVASVASAAPASSPASAPAAHPATAHAAAVAVPGSVRLQYKVQMHRGLLTLDGHGELRWRHDGQSYEARLEFSAPFVRSRWQHSVGRITAQGLAPQRFADKARSEEATHFDREKDKLVFSSNRPDAPLMPGMQDRLSVMLQLAAMVAGDPARYPPATSITIPTAGTHDAEPWVFMVEGQEQLQLPGGRVPALKLTRSPRKEYDVKVELWLAPGMDYVPVRLRLTQPNGDSVDQQWSSTDRG